jgi:hypothetical protein
MTISAEKIIINNTNQLKTKTMNELTLDKMRKMKLLGMYHAFKTDLETDTGEKYTPDEIVAHLVEAEWDQRQQRNIDHKIKNARFRYKAALEDLHYNT